MITKIRKMLQRESGQKGFTLVELIVVIAILGILTAIAVPKYNATLNEAKENAAVADCRTIASAVTLYQTAKDNNASATPKIEELDDYLTDADSLADKYKIVYSETKAEIEKITLTTSIDGKDTWEPGSNELE